MSPAVRSALDQPAQFVKGVGPRRAEALERLGVRTARDLLFHVPRRYEDATTVTRIADVRVGADATVIGEVVAKGVLPTRSGLRIFQAVVRDGSGSIECAWPGQPFLDRSIHRGDLLLVTGPARFFHGVQIQPREFVSLGRADETESAGRVLPIYPATEGLTQKQLRAILDQNLDRLIPLLATEEVFAPDVLRELGLPTLMQSIAWLHRPESVAQAERGRRRLAYDELFFLQLLHARARQRAHRATPGIAFPRTNQLIQPLYRGLPFPLTGAQTRAIAEIFSDMTAERRMNRLLQGDVGSGKTVVALFAMLLAAESGHQSALMAPTEILAEQHARTVERLLEALPVGSALLTGSMGAAERRDAEARIASGDALLVIGTHALIQEAVRFRRLGLVVVDEQHRFGVRQRLALAAQAANGEGTGSPDMLVMSATPIPRSLALTLYGDLDLSVLDELPPGRRPVHTQVLAESERAAVHERVRAEARRGRQAYVVYPLIEESEKVELRAAAAEFDRLASDIFPELRLGLLHGQMTGEQKDQTMRAFARGEIDVLVTTTVVEVGIDVANATLMVVEHAERFGLSQLHQLRGRVGRGAAESTCILMTGAEGAERLRVLASTQDGFEIARADLRIRGMGDFFGARQHGLPEFRFFDPERDEDLLHSARRHATEMADRDPELEQPAHAPLAQVLSTRYADRERLYTVG